jgi:hypothetical protein
MHKSETLFVESPIQVSKQKTQTPRNLSRRIGDKELRVYQSKKPSTPKTNEYKRRAHPHICCIIVPPMARFHACTVFTLNRHEVNTNPFFPLSHHDFETILPTSASSNTAAPQDLNGKKTQFCTPQGHLFPAMT